MKIHKINFFILLMIFCFLGTKVLAIGSSQFPDATKLQPMPADTYPNIPGNANREEAINLNNDILFRQLSRYNIDRSQMNQNTSYTDNIDHRLFVTDTENNRVFVFILSTDNVLNDYNPDYVLGQPDFVTSTSGTTQSTLNGPNGIAYDSVNSTLFVADTNNNRIMVFDVSTITNGENAINVLGQPDFVTSTPGTTQAKMDGPYHLDYDGAHNILYVTDANNNRIMAFNTNPIINGENAINVLGQPDFVTSTSGTTQAKLDKPNGIAYDAPNSALFVADVNNNRIMVFNVSTITNGENAIDVLTEEKFETLLVSPVVASRVKISQESEDSLAEKISNSAQQPKKNPITAILLWLVILSMGGVVAFFYVKPKS